MGGGSVLRVVKTDKAPAAIGPYSQGILSNGFLFVSGQLPLNPITGELLNDFQSAVEQAIKNVISVVEAAGGKLEDIVKVTVYIRDMQKFSIFNEVYSKFFSEHKPARAVVEVSNLPKNALLEIEAIACISNG